jgi:hypothetical protein
MHSHPQLLREVGERRDLLGVGWSDDEGGKPVGLRLGHGESIKAQGKKNGSNHFPFGRLKPNRFKECTTLVIGLQSNPGMVPLWRPHPTFGAMLRPAQRKKPPRLSRACGQGRVRDNGFFLRFSIGNVWENFSDVRLAFPR